MRFFLRAAALLLLAAFPFIGYAQDTEPTIVDLSDGYTISIPEGWKAEEDDRTGGFILTNAEIEMLVLTPVDIAELVDVDAGEIDLLRDLYEELYDERPRRSEVEETEIGDVSPSSSVTVKMGSTACFSLSS